MSTPSELLTNLANTVREKTGLENPLSISAMTDAVGTIITMDEFLSPSLNIREFVYKGTELRTSKASTTHINFFEGLTSLEKISAQNLLRIPDYTFRYCTNLKTINLQNCKEIGRYAFHNNNLEEIRLPNIELIELRAFSGNNNLIFAELGEKIENIQQYAFDTTNLVTLIIRNPNKVVDLGDISVFDNTPIGNWGEMGNGQIIDTFIYVPDNLYNDYLEDTNWCFWGQDMIDSEMEPIIKPLSTYTGGTT